MKTKKKARKVRVDSGRAITPAEAAEIQDLTTIPYTDDDLDLVDVPEVKDWSGAVRGRRKAN